MTTTPNSLKSYADMAKKDYDPRTSFKKPRKEVQKKPKRDSSDYIRVKKLDSKESYSDRFGNFYNISYRKKPKFDKFLEEYFIEADIVAEVERLRKIYDFEQLRRDGVTTYLKLIEFASPELFQRYQENKRLIEGKK